MSARPAPRRSSLAGATPVAPPIATPPALLAVEPEASNPTPAVVDQPAVATPAVVDQPAVATPAASRPRPKYPPKVSFYQAAEDTARVRGAILHTMATEGPRSLSQFIHEAVMAEVSRLEVKYNDGRPFPPVEARVLPQGRPMQD